VRGHISPFSEQVVISERIVIFPPLKVWPQR
jgi:hypothetical protein